MHKTWLGVAAFLALAALAVAAWLYRSEATVEQGMTARPDAVETMADVEAEESELTGAVANEDNSDAGSPRRVLNIPLPSESTKAQNPRFDLQAITADNIDSMIHETFKQALDGDFEAAHFVPRAKETCQLVPRDPELIEAHIQRTMQRYQWMQDSGHDPSIHNRIDHPHNVFPTEAENRRHLEGWGRACSRVDAIFTPELLLELDQLASQGHVIARYLFAMWRMGSQDSREAFEVTFAWEEKAREYSLANLQEGEAMGMLAFGQSYQRGLFTPNSFDLSLGFVLAAMNCGLEVAAVEQWATAFFNRPDETGDPENAHRFQFALETADSLVEYCH